jgi:hypothetical protein
MPVEIRELVIRAVVDDRPSAQAREPGAAEPRTASKREDLIQACVTQVLRILRRERER